jgi:hypothetical protein
MMPACVADQAPIPPPPYHRLAQRAGLRLQIDALTLVTLCWLRAPCHAR